MNNLKPPVTDAGIYYGLSDFDYHQIPALSASGIKELMVSPLDFWASKIAKVKAAETKALSLGKAAHKLLLEGRAAFDAEYQPLPEQDDYLVTCDDLDAALVERGLKKAGKKEDKIARLLEVWPAAPIWERVKQQAAEDGITLLDDYENLIRMEKAAKEQHPDLFQGLKPEVTLVWNDADYGFLCKARLDGLAPKTHSLELKTFVHGGRGPVESSPGAAIARYGYHLQAKWYGDGKAALGIEAQRHTFLFTRTELGWPQFFARDFQQTEYDGGTQNTYWISARVKVDEARRVYADYLEGFGWDINRPWEVPQQRRPLIDSDLPLWVND